MAEPAGDCRLGSRSGGRAAAAAAAAGDAAALRADSARQAGLRAYQLGDLKQAEQLFSESIALEPGNIVHHSNRCQVNLALRRCVAANKDADNALRLDASCAKAWYRKGRAQEGLGRWSSALTCLERALELLPPENKMHAQVRQAVGEVQQQLNHQRTAAGARNQPAPAETPAAAASSACPPGRPGSADQHAVAEPNASAPPRQPSSVLVRSGVEAEAGRPGRAVGMASDAGGVPPRLRRVSIRLKFGGGAAQRREELEVVVPAAGEEARSRCETCVHFFREVAARVHVHLESMTLIYCGKKLTADRLHTVQDKALILVLGRAKEDETGCDLRDVDCMMAQLGLGRDECVRLLKRHDFDLLDAMLHS